MEQTPIPVTSHIQNLLDTLPDALLVTTMDGVITTVNLAALDLMSSDAEAVVGQSLGNWVAAEARLNFQKLLRQAVSQNASSPITMHLGGQVRQMSISVACIATGEREKAPQELRWLLQEARDGALRQMTAQVHRQGKERDQLIGSIPGLVWELWNHPDAGLPRLNFVSPYVEKLLGYRVDEWLQATDFWLACIHEDDRQRVENEIADLQTAGQEAVLQFRWIAKNGDVIWVDTHAVVIADDAKKMIGLRGVSLDITPHKLTEATLRQRVEELARMTEALERKNQELDQFAYITSHDLKAPLRGIANLSRWIEEDLEGKIPAESREQFEMLRGRAQRMEAMIEGILQYSRVGRVTLRTHMVDVARLLDDVITLLAVPPEFTIEIASKMPTLLTEEVRLEQVFLNLIGNAVKHHDRPDGHVWISAEDREDWIEFTVKDDGPGIAPQYHERVFVIFQTLVARDRTENTGVGLALAKKIVENQGGSIALESEENAGATFRFTWMKRSP